MKNGFTLIELIVSVSIIAILSTIILFSTVQYINKGKDSNVSGNLAVLIPAGEAYYNIGETYGKPDDLQNFCKSGVVKYTRDRMAMPSPAVDCVISGDDYQIDGLCCNVSDTGNAWVACAQEFTNPLKAFCVDSRGVKKEICNSSCNSPFTITQCPEVVDLSTCI